MAGKLEDICFKILFPKSYEETSKWLQMRSAAGEDLLDTCREQLQAALASNSEFTALAGDVVEVIDVKLQQRAMLFVASISMFWQCGNDIQPTTTFVGVALKLKLHHSHLKLVCHHDLPMSRTHVDLFTSLAACMWPVPDDA
eukprot:scaffold71258_cov18-Prasinocladus_malaysianus.AAC.1